MKIAVIQTGFNNELTNEARAFLPKLLKGLAEKGDEIHLIERSVPDEEAVGQATVNVKNPLLHRYAIAADASVEETAAEMGRRLGEINPDVYFIWDADETGWTMLPVLPPSVATLAVGHADSESFYAPLRHYRPFVTRVVGTTPEVCVGVVLSCVIDKERVEWISYEAPEGENNTEAADKNVQKVIETYRLCFEKSVSDAHAAPREALEEFTPMKTNRPASESWFSKLKAKLMK